MQNNQFFVVMISCVISILFFNCAKNTAPKRWLDRPVETKVSDAFGGWIEIWDQAKSKKQFARGELIAIGKDSLFLFTGDLFEVIPFSKISKAQITGYDSQHSSIGGWTFLGTVSTLLHGFVLVLSAPIWIISGSSMTASQSKKPVLKFPDKPLSEFSKYARFPQGLPEGLDRSKLKPKKILGNEAK